jgi:uncharacterized RDD family membrane protein YckC
MADFGPPPDAGGGVQSGPRASFGVRFVALLIDVVLLGVVGSITSMIFRPAIGSILQLLIGLAYYSYLEGSPSGQTVGKRVMSIRVIDFNTGGPIGTTRGLIRYISRLVSTIPCLLGYFWMLWDPQKQTWHDKFATTVVVPTADYPVAAWPG